MAAQSERGTQRLGLGRQQPARQLQHRARAQLVVRHTQRAQKRRLAQRAQDLAEVVVRELGRAQGDALQLASAAEGAQEQRQQFDGALVAEVVAAQIEVLERHAALLERLDEDAQLGRRVHVAVDQVQRVDARVALQRSQIIVIVAQKAPVVRKSEVPGTCTSSCTLP